MASRCTTAFVEPPTAASATIALRKDPAEMTELMVRPSCTISTARRPVWCEASSSRLSAAGVPARPGIVMPSASAMTAIVDAVPIVLQCPRLRIIEDSDFRNSSSGNVPARTSSLSCHTPGAAAEQLAAERAVEHRAAGHHDGRDIDRGRGHEQRGDGLVAARRAGPARRWGWPGTSPPWPSRPCCATASPSVGRASRRARRPAGSGGCHRPRRRLASPSWRPRPGARCTASGPRRCWRSRSAGGRRKRSAAAPRRIHARCR